MSELFGNHIVGFPTRWLKCFDPLEAVKHTKGDSMDYIKSKPISFFFLLYLRLFSITIVFVGFRFFRKKVSMASEKCLSKHNGE